METKKLKIILASASPRRKELLAGLDLDFEVKVLKGVSESYPESLRAEEVPQYISREKAARRAAAHCRHGGCCRQHNTGQATRCR